MKKITAIIICVIGGLTLTGCVPETLVSKSNTLAAPAVETNLKAKPIVADLNVSGNKARGEAQGVLNEYTSEETITQEAIANALGQNPPKIEGADLLVGMNVYTKRTNDLLHVRVTGYPAWYTNFRHVEEDSAQLRLVGLVPLHYGHGYLREEAPQAPRAPQVWAMEASGRNYDYYFALRWLPVSSPAYAGGGNLELGTIWRNNMFFGGDFGIVVSDDGEHIGGGLNLGRVYDLSPDLRLVYGGSAGFWYGGEQYYYSGYNYSGYDWTDSYYFFGPFVKLRWSILEISNRLLIGDDVSYQLGIGFYFEGSKRRRH